MSQVTRINTTHPSFNRYQKSERTFVNIITNKRGNVSITDRLESAQKLLTAVQKGIVCNEQAIITGLTPLKTHPELGTVSTQILEIITPVVLQTPPPAINPPVSTPSVIINVPEETEPPTVRQAITPPAPSQTPTTPPASKPAPAVKQTSRALKAIKWALLLATSPIWIIPYLAVKLVGLLTKPKTPEYASTVKGALYTPLHIAQGLGGYCSVGGRSNNEDAAAIDGLYLRVFDGMGGHNGGEVAADVAVHKTRQSYLASRSSGKPLDAAQTLFLADEAIKLRAQKQPTGSEPLAGMGAAAITTVIQGNKAQVAWAGDARLYILRGRELILRTVDNHEHTLQWGSDKGVLTQMVSPNGALAYPFTQAETADYHEHTRSASGGILNPLGHLNGQENVSRATIELKPGDTLLLSTDGLHGFIPFDVLQGLLKHNAHLPATERARLLTEIALEYMKAAGKEGDNATAIVADLVADKKGDLTFQTKAKADTNTYHSDGSLRSKVLDKPLAISPLSFSAGTTIYYDENGIVTGAILRQGIQIDGQTFAAGTRFWFNEQGEIIAARLAGPLLIKGIDLNAGSYLFYTDGQLTGAELFGDHILFGVPHRHRTNLLFTGDNVTIKIKLTNGDTKIVNGLEYTAKSQLVYSIYGKLVEARFFGALSLPGVSDPIPPGSRLFFSAGEEIQGVELAGPLTIFGTEYPAGSKVNMDTSGNRVASVITGADMGPDKAGAQIWFDEHGNISALKYNQSKTYLGVEFAPGLIERYSVGGTVTLIPAEDLVLGNFVIASGSEIQYNDQNHSLIVTVPADPNKLANAANEYTDLPIGSRLEMHSDGTVISITPADKWEGVAAGNTVYLKNDGNWDALEVNNQQKIGHTTWLAGSVLFFSGDKIINAQAKAGQELAGKWRLKRDRELQFSQDGQLLIPASDCDLIAPSAPPAPATPPAPAARFTLAPAFDINDIKSVRSYLRALGALADIDGELTAEEETIVNQENERLEQIKQRYGSDQWINMQCIAARTKILELLMG